MSCPLCGEECRCERSRPTRARPRFRPTGADLRASADDCADRVLLEPEDCDTSEQQFTASLEAPGSGPRFVLDPPDSSRPRRGRADSLENRPADEPSAQDETVLSKEAMEAVEETIAESEAAGLAIQLSEEDAASLEASAGIELAGEMPAESAMSTWDQSEGGEPSLGEEPEWRQEVAARLHNYHSRRRKRPPRYPSLALKFDPPVYASSSVRAAEPPRLANYQAGSRSEAATAAVAAPEPMEEPPVGPADGTNIIEFPRPLVPPTPSPDELAEPMLDFPRILDAPETVPKQVPLGGIILEEEDAPVTSDLELPLRVAALDRRLLAAGVDGVLVGAATLMFAAIADKIAALLPSLHVLLGLGVALPVILWAVFQYVFLVYSGTTPGMRVTRLRLTDFDGHVPDRGTRRWRALAMALSALSLGLGFLWCLLDEDTLCWHDRITRTYLDGGAPAEAGARPGPVFPQRLFALLRQAEAFLQRRDRETEQEPPAPPQG